ncbi:MAG TPA: tetratricopeptide repeat protein [Bryobacteraceae bacterium]|jgi:predicted CXXCH cytochrome family protein
MKTGLAFALLFTSALPAATQYANSKLCAACHPAIAKSWQQNGMGRSFAAPRPEILVEDFTKKNSYYHPASNTYYQMLNRNGVLVQRRYQLGFEGKETNLDEKQIDYIVGSGNHMRTYVHRNADGTLVELPLAWYAEKGGYWAMNPGYDAPDYPYARRQIAYDCMFCHNAYPQTPGGHDRLGDRPVYSGKMPEGIDCQRCHGPGQKHIDVASTPDAKPADIRAAIVNPRKLDNDRQIEVCAQCHLKTTEFRLPHAIKRYERPDFSYQPGQPLASFLLAFDEAPGPKKDTRFETASAVSRMRASQCFLKSNGKLTCTTCHDPHDIRHGAEAAEKYNSVCRGCHTGALALKAGHPAQTGCIDCHMPKRRTEDIVHMAITDHLIQRNKPEGDLLADITERHEDSTNSYRGEVVPYYPGHLSNSAENLYYLALAQVRDRANLEKGLPIFEKALSAVDKRPEPYLEFAQALLAARQPARALLAFQESLRRDPSYVPALLEYAVALKENGQPAQAVRAAKRATGVAPTDPRGWNALGQAQLDIGDFNGARASFKQALSLDPELPEAHNGVGIASSQLGDPLAGEAEFREAVRVLPNYGEAHGNLGNVLAWKQDFPQAAYEFDQAVRLGPADVAARLNYGALLNSMRKFGEAQVQIEAALRLDPKLAEAHDLLGTLLERAGHVDAALREYSEAVRLRPDLSHAQLDLGGALANQGNKAAAIEHLRLAAKSADPNLRDLALRLLKDLESK